MHRLLYIATFLVSIPLASTAQNTVDFSSFTRTSYHEVTVHDPSIVYDNAGTYYIFGSHCAISMSTDIINWTQFDYFVNNYGNLGCQNTVYTIEGNE